MNHGIERLSLSIYIGCVCQSTVLRLVVPKGIGGGGGEMTTESITETYTIPKKAAQNFNRILSKSVPVSETLKDTPKFKVATSADIDRILSKYTHR
jgi:hypothetical protein